MALTKLTDIRKSLSVEVEDLKVNGITTFTGSVSIGGTLTYEDVTNIDSVGIITARSGIKDSTLTSGRITYAGAGGRLVDSSNLTYDGANVTTVVSGNSGYKINASGNNAPQIRGDANRSAQNNTLLSLHGDWNGTAVTMIDLAAGADTTNKDDGQIGFYTRPSGGSMAQRLHINSSGQTIINSSGTESGTVTKLAVCATGSPGSNPSLQNNTVASFRATGSSAHAASIAILAGNSGSSAVHFGDTDNDIIGRLLYNHTSSNTSDYFEFFLQGSRRFRIQGNGNLCIGNDSNFTAGAKVEIRDTIGGGGGTGLILNDIGSSGANEGLHIEWRSGSDKQSDQCRIGQNSNSTGSGSHFFIATNPGDTGSSQTRLVIGSAGQFGIGGFTYGTAGQVLTSGGASSPPTWTTPSSGVTITGNADNKVITGGSGTNLNAESNVYIDSNGKMSLGATSADRILDIHQSTTNAYSATGYSGADNTLLRIHNPSGTDNQGVGYHTGLEFVVSSGANSYGQLGYVRTGNNTGDFFFKHRTGASSYRETLRVKSDNCTQLGGYLGTGATNSGVLSETVKVNCSLAGGYDNRHTVTFGQTDGNWNQGTSGGDTSWGLMWHYAPSATGARQLRAGIHFDHSNTEQFKIWSAYGDIVFYQDLANSGSETAESCDTECARFDANGHFVPGSNNARDLGTSSKKWRNIYVMDMHFSNEGGSPNSVDGTTGNWTLQEGEDGIYMINNKNGKKYEMMLKEVQ